MIYSYISLYVTYVTKYLSEAEVLKYQFVKYDTAVVHDTKYLSKNINKTYPPTTLYGMSPFTLISLQEEKESI